MDDFGARMASGRKARGLTQEQLAQMLHVSRQAVSHWETGRALPDVAMAQQIAEALGFREAEVQLESLVPAAVQPPVEKGKILRWGWIVACTALLIGLAAGLLMSTLMPQADALQPGRAVITVTPEAEVAPFFVNDMFPQGGWDVGFNFANVSDVAFRPSYLIARYYAGDEVVSAVTVTYEQLLPWMASDMLRQGDPPLRWPFGTNHLYTTHMECILYGTDVNGNELSFTGSVQYQRPPAE